ncbi:MAG: hypothetical protein JXA46_13965 [Dehalococcoidales bacterium]|nr:hypothetical protein [Dehalococcoidales bacterium]
MTVCKRHPKTETNLYCGKCGDPICPRCMVQTPVGARCPSCARLSRVPTYNITSVYYLRAVGAALVLALVCGFLWGFLRSIMFSGYFNFLIAAALGYGIGEGISLSVNRKSGVGLAIIGGTTLVVAYVISVFTFGGNSFRLFDILAVVIGIFVTVARLR